MTISDAYKVVTTGQILEGFDPDDVQKRLVSVLRLKPEQAETFFEKPRILRKDVSWASADEICTQLARLGISAEIQENAPAAVSEPVEPNPSLQEEPSLELVEDKPDAAAKKHAFECPSCQHPQDKSEQCESCGIWFHKFEAAAAPAPASRAPQVMAAAAVPAHDSTVVTTEVDEVTGSLSVVAIIAAVGAALLGALIWRFVAVTFEYELGLIAWGIGGAVGFAAASAGSRGMQAGVVCALLAFGSIVVGKYWAYSGFVDQIQEAVTEVMEIDDEMAGYFEEQMEDARQFAAGSGSDAFVRQFMVDRNYSEATDPARVGADEIEYFREWVEPELREVAQNDPSFEEWQDGAFDGFDDISPWTMMRENFGILDILFIFLGVGTAFRLGSQSD